MLDCVDFLVAHEGAEVTWLEPDRCGRIAVDDVRAAIEADADAVALVSVMWANNEVGTVQPVAEIAAVAREHGVPVHTDAVQAVGHLPVRFAACGADLLTRQRPQDRRPASASAPSWPGATPRSCR